MESRCIKLLLPNKTYINVNIDGNEKDLRELLSTLTEITPENIKGFKDSFGNYFTLSSTLKNNTKFKQVEGKYYELVYKKNSKKIESIDTNFLNTKKKSKKILEKSRKDESGRTKKSKHSSSKKKNSNSNTVSSNSKSSLNSIQKFDDDIRKMGFGLKKKEKINEKGPKVSGKFGVEINNNLITEKENKKTFKIFNTEKKKNCYNSKLNFMHDNKDREKLNASTSRNTNPLYNDKKRNTETNVMILKSLNKLQNKHNLIEINNKNMNHFNYDMKKNSFPNKTNSNNSIHNKQNLLIKSKSPDNNEPPIRQLSHINNNIYVPNNNRNQSNDSESSYNSSNKSYRRADVPRRKTIPVHSISPIKLLNDDFKPQENNPNFFYNLYTPYNYFNTNYNKINNEYYNYLNNSGESNNSNLYKKLHNNIKKISTKDPTSIKFCKKYIKKLKDEYIFNDSTISNLCKGLEDSNGSEIIKEFDNFLEGNQTRANLIKNLSIISSKYNSNKISNIKIEEVYNREESPFSIDNELRDDLIGKIKGYFKKHDLNIIKKLFKYENNSLIKEIKNYNGSKNIKKFITNLKSIIKKYKEMNNTDYTLSENSSLDISSSNKSRDNSYKNKGKKSIKNLRNKRYDIFKSKTFNSKKKLERVSIHLDHLDALDKKKNNNLNEKKSSKNALKDLLVPYNLFYYSMVKNQKNDNIKEFKKNIKKIKLKSDNTNLEDKLNKECFELFEKEIIAYAKKKNIFLNNNDLNDIYQHLRQNYDSLKHKDNLLTSVQLYEYLLNQHNKSNKINYSEANVNNKESNRISNSKLLKKSKFQKSCFSKKCEKTSSKSKVTSKKHSKTNSKTNSKSHSKNSKNTNSKNSMTKIYSEKSCNDINYYSNTSNVSNNTSEFQDLSNKIIIKSRHSSSSSSTPEKECDSNDENKLIRNLQPKMSDDNFKNLIINEEYNKAESPNYNIQTPTIKVEPLNKQIVNKNQSSGAFSFGKFESFSSGFADRISVENTLPAFDSINDLVIYLKDKKVYNDNCTGFLEKNIQSKAMFDLFMDYKNNADYDLLMKNLDNFINDYFLKGQKNLIKIFLNSKLINQKTAVIIYYLIDKRDSEILSKIENYLKYHNKAEFVEALKFTAENLDQEIIKNILEKFSLNQKDAKKLIKIFLNKSDKKNEDVYYNFMNILCDYLLFKNYDKANKEIIKLLKNL